MTIMGIDGRAECMKAEQVAKPAMLKQQPLDKGLARSIAQFTSRFKSVLGPLSFALSLAFSVDEWKCQYVC